MKEKFGEFIKKKRTERMIKLNVFAHKIGISTVYASYLESGKRPAPSERILNAIVEQLSLDPAETEKLMRLAAETHRRPSLPADMIKYISENEIVYQAIRTAMERQVPAEAWQSFIDRVTLTK